MHFHSTNPPLQTGHASNADLHLCYEMTETREGDARAHGRSRHNWRQFGGQSLSRVTQSLLSLRRDLNEHLEGEDVDLMLCWKDAYTISSCVH